MRTFMAIAIIGLSAAPAFAQSEAAPGVGAGALTAAAALEAGIDACSRRYGALYAGTDMQPGERRLLRERCRMMAEAETLQLELAARLLERQARRQ